VLARDAVCLLDVPTHKTGTAFTKPVDPILGKAIEAWQAARPDQPAILDPKTNERVNFLFAFRARRVAGTGGPCRRPRPARTNCVKASSSPWKASAASAWACAISYSLSRCPAHTASTSARSGSERARVFNAGPNLSLQIPAGCGYKLTQICRPDAAAEGRSRGDVMRIIFQRESASALSTSCFV